MENNILFEAFYEGVLAGENNQRFKKIMIGKTEAYSMFLDFLQRYKNNNMYANKKEVERLTILFNEKKEELDQIEKKLKEEQSRIPLGYEFLPVGETIPVGSIVYDDSLGAWVKMKDFLIGTISGSHGIARPMSIPEGYELLNEGDTIPAGSIVWDCDGWRPFSSRNREIRVRKDSLSMGYKYAKPVEPTENKEMEGFAEWACENYVFYIDYHVHSDKQEKTSGWVSRFQTPNPGVNPISTGQLYRTYKKMIENGQI